MNRPLVIYRVDLIKLQEKSLNPANPPEKRHFSGWKVCNVAESVGKYETVREVSSLLLQHFNLNDDSAEFRSGCFVEFTTWKYKKQFPFRIKRIDVSRCDLTKLDWDVTITKLMDFLFSIVKSTASSLPLTNSNLREET